MLTMSPRPPPDRFRNMGHVACVMRTNPVTLVHMYKHHVDALSTISGALAIPLTRPLPPY